SNPRALLPAPVAIKPDRTDSAARHSNNTRSESDPSTDTTTQPNTNGSFYNAGKSSSPDDNFKPALPSPRAVSTAVKGRSAKSSGGAAIPAGSYTLQVAA